jgi:hypothetical protein
MEGGNRFTTGLTYAFNQQTQLIAAGAALNLYEYQNPRKDPDYRRKV